MNMTFISLYKDFSSSSSVQLVMMQMVRAARMLGTFDHFALFGVQIVNTLLGNKNRIALLFNTQLHAHSQSTYKFKDVNNLLNNTVNKR